MRSISIPLCPDAEDEAIVAAIERACMAAGLVIAMRGTLRTYRGCVHWHFKNVDERRGTLEATYWPRERRAWFSVQSGRDAGWIDRVLPGILAALHRT